MIRKTSCRLYSDLDSGLESSIAVTTSIKGFEKRPLIPLRLIFLVLNMIASLPRLF